jgi:hypothetical protein
MDEDEISTEWENENPTKEWGADPTSEQSWNDPAPIRPGSNTSTRLSSQISSYGIPSSMGSSQIGTPTRYSQGLTDSQPFAPEEFFGTRLSQISNSSGRSTTKTQREVPSNIGALMWEKGEWDQSWALSVQGCGHMLEALIRGSTVTAQAFMAHIEYNDQNGITHTPAFKDILERTSQVAAELHRALEREVEKLADINSSMINTSQPGDDGSEIEEDEEEGFGRGLETSIHASSNEPPHSQPMPNMPETQDPVLKMCLEMIKEMREDRKMIVSRLDALDGKQSAAPAPTPAWRSRAQPQPKTANPKNSKPDTPATPAAPTYAQKASTGSNEQTTSKPVATPKPPQKKEDVRFVLRAQGGIPSNLQIQPFEIKDRLRETFKNRSGVENTILKEAKWNRSNNLVLTFPYNCNVKAILNLADEIKKALRIPTPTTFIRDVAWSRIMLTNVLTGVNAPVNKGLPFSDEYLREQLTDNDCMKKINITQNPRWVPKPDTITKDRSSIVFAFEDPDGTILPTLLKARFNMCGSAAVPKRWNDKPVLKLCYQCLSYDHHQAGCQNKVRCGKCSLAHGTTTHRANCKKCGDEGKKSDEPCTHDPKCGVCGGKHEFRDPSCPKLTDYRVPITATLLANQPDNMET